jgi:alanine racemase
VSLSRREFLTTSATLAAIPVPHIGSQVEAGAGSVRTDTAHRTVRDSRSRGFDPWIEVLPEAINHNVSEVARLAGNRPILAVVKNNAYGLGVETVGRILDQHSQIVGLAVVKADQALRLRSAGVRKPIVLMGQFDEPEGEELVTHGIELAPYSEAAEEILVRIAQQVGRPIPVHLYLDTGMSRLGMPYRRAAGWAQRISDLPRVEVQSTFSALTEEDDFDQEQVRRFLEVARKANQHGVALGMLHLASSHGLFFRPAAHLDMVRPGLSLYGAYPAGAREHGSARLVPAFRLKARVVRVERLEAGDSVSYGREYVADEPTWVATLPVGHADGYPRRAVRGCEVLLGGRLYPVIGAVSASHTIVELGIQQAARVGDVATLVGPDSAQVHPNTVATRAGISVYDVLMHLGAQLPKRVVRDTVSGDEPAQ